MPRLSNVQQANLVRKRNEPRNCFYTPKSIVDIQLKKLVPYVQQGWKILEPCRGQGAYYNEFAKVFPHCTYDWCEIDEGRDFLEYSIGNTVDVIITNPPFSIFDKFIERMISLNPRYISIVCNMYSVTPCRLRKFNDAGFFVLNYHLTRINRWFGISVILTLTREIDRNIVEFDCTKHVLESITLDSPLSSENVSATSCEVSHTTEQYLRHIDM